MEPLESTGLFTPLNQFAINQNSDLIDIQGNLQPFNQMGVGYQNIAFIDPTVKDYQNLVNGIVPNTEIVLLDPTRDGVEQITQILADRTEISSAHIITHGGEASLQLGTAQLSLENLDLYRPSLEEWKNALTPDADILLYGCNVAAGEKGTAFVQYLSQITDADIAASDDLTGSAALGGDWQFEVKTGEIEAKLALKAETIANYDSVLLSFAPVSNFPVTASLRNLAVGDFNKDSNPDLVTASTWLNYVSTILGTGTGSFGTATQYSAPLGQYTWAVAVGDLNEDGNLDLATANNGTSNVSILLGNGTGNFGTATNFNVGSGPYSVAIEDFNKDGNLDLTTANQSSQNVSVLLGDGTGQFGTLTNFSTGSSPSCVVVGDFNKDGNFDLATANQSSNNISILLGDGTGKFGNATNFSTGGSTTAIVAKDFNQDGNLDLATANGYSNNVSVLLGNGTGNFGTATNYTVGNETLFIAAGDLDGDGNIDLATADNLSNRVSVLLGTATGNFNSAINFAVGTNPQGIVIADLNKDGLLDIATANFGSQNVSVLINSNPLVNFGAGTFKATEESNDAVVNIPVTLSATPGTDVTVPIVINNSSTATEGVSNDFILSTTSVTFKAGATGDDLTQNIAVTIKPDNISENDEKLILDFGAITAAAAGTTKQTTLTIVANDGVDYAVGAGVANIPEANSGITPLTFTVTRSGGIDAGSKVDFAIGGTAANNSDYKDIGGTSGATGTTGTITFTAGETQKTITMNVVGDTAVEPDETVIVSLSNPVAPGPPPTISNVSATTTINNDDTVPQPGTLQFTAANFSVPEGNSGTFVNATAVTVNRTGGSSGAVSVQARVNPNNPGTPNENDYNNNAFPITVNFADGDTAAKTVIIPINGDTTVEPDETVNLELIPGTVTGGATIGSQNTAILTISNDDNAGILQFSAANFSVPEGNSGGFVNATAVTVNRTGGSSGAVSAAVWANPNLGTANTSDFGNNSSIVNFADGDTAAKTVVLLINGDTVVEPDETMMWEFVPGSVRGGATIGSQNTTTLTITNDEPFDEINAGLPGIFSDSAVWGDYDNDGKLDILVTGSSPSGSSPSGRIAKVYRNTGNGFIDINAGLTGVSQRSAAWGDYDNDGKLDILLTGDTGSGSIAKVYRNTGNGFTDINAGLTGVSQGSAAWGDYDNDGKLDILLTGAGSGFIAKVYRNTGNGFTDINAGLTGSYNSSAAWGDYNNDGKLDILLTGSSNSSSGLTTKVYRNTGNGFTDINAGLPSIYNSSAAWGDYDNDGKLDILLTGDTAGSGFITKVYRNTGNGFSDINADLTGVSQGSAAWGDYDNDGKLDILLMGNIGSGSGITKLYRNTGSGFTDSNIGLPSTRSNLVAWGDYDNDGKLDMVFTDHFSGLTKLYRNKTLTANTPPTTPTGLSSTISGTAVTLNWNPATDAQTPTTGLGYNLRVGTTPGGNDVFAPMSLNTGYRQVPELGNTNMKTSWQLNNLTPGQTYYWSVQGIDTAWAGSPFATEGSFTVVNPTPSTVSISTTDAEAGEAANGQTPNPGQFTISRTGNTANSLTVNYTTAGTATNGQDYNNILSSITIPAGASSANLPINVIDDNQAEGNEMVSLTLIGNTAYNIGDAKSATVTIADNEPTIAIPTISGSQSINATLSSTDPNNPTRSGKYKDDYRLVEVTPGQTIQINLNASSFDTYLQLINADTGQVISYDDDGGEGVNSQLSLTVQPGINYLVRVSSYYGGDTGNYTLITRIPTTPPVVTVSATDAFAAEVVNGQPANPGQFTLTRTGNTTNSLTVNYNMGGTATKGTDYNNILGNIIIPAGTNSANLPINVIDDSLREGNETAILTLAANSAYTIGNTKNSIINIADNERFGPPPRPGSGQVIDGYIAGATIFFDANKNGVIDDNEPSATTDNFGAYQLDISPDFDTNNNGQFDPEEGMFVAYSGTDTATGLPLETPLSAPPYASVVTLLTSLVTESIDRGMNPDEAESQVKAALSLPSDVNLTSLDPIAATNNDEPGGVEVLAAMVKVQNFITQTKVLIDGALGIPQNTATAKNEIVQGIVGAIVNQIESGVILDFTNPEQLAVIIEASVNKTKQFSPTFNSVVNSEFIASSAKVMAEVNQRIDKIVATTATESIHQQISRVQKVALGEVTSDFKAAASGTKSINEVIAENTGAALNTQIQTATIPGVPSIPTINHLPKFDSTLLFDSDFYLQQNKDVADAVANKLFPDALAHFSQFGWAESRNPSSLFATDYLNKNSDVAAAVGKGFFHSGFEHFIKYGMVEGRSPAPEFMPLDEFYLSANQDVAQAVSQGSFKSGIEHLIRFGMEEKRDPFTRFNIVSETFDPTFYLAWNQDVAEAIDRGEFRDSWEHFVNFGRFESRDPSILFSNFSYLKENQDVAAAISQGKFQNGFDHYLKFGFLEKRKSNDLSVPLFF